MQGERMSRLMLAMLIVMQGLTLLLSAAINVPDHDCHDYQIVHADDHHSADGRESCHGGNSVQVYKGEFMLLLATYLKG